VSRITILFVITFIEIFGIGILQQTNRLCSGFVCLVQALADISGGKKKVLVPYRDSILTKLLQNALGGNRFVRDD